MAASAQKSDFSALVRDHQGHVRTFLARLCRNTALADDLAQDTFLRAFRQYGTLKDPTAAKAWLFQIAYRIFLDHYRKQARRGDIDAASRDDFEIGAQTTPTAPGVKMDVEQAMNALPAAQRAAILLNISYGLSHSETARALGIPLGTAKSHIARGKDQLRAFLRAYEKA